MRNKDRINKGSFSLMINPRVPSVAYALTLQDRLKSFEAMLSDLKEAGNKDRLRLLEE